MTMQILDSRRNQIILMGIICFLAVHLLFYLDHETKSLWQFMGLKELPIILLYFLPAFALSVSYNHRLQKIWTPVNALTIATLAGIVSGFGIVITVMRL